MTTKNSSIYLFCLLLLSGCAAHQPIKQTTITHHYPQQRQSQSHQHSTSAHQPAQTHTPVIIQQTTTITPITKPQTPSTQTQASQVQAPTNHNYGNFADWKADFSRRAINAGYNRYAVQQLINSAQLNQQVLSLDSGQPEFAKMPWEYVDSAVSGGRVNRGKNKFAEQRSLLSRLETQYGVNADIIAGIWGMESSYGAVTGNSDLPSALSSLAYDGRRRSFAESQLLAMLQLIQRGDISPYDLKGSWAGGMGQTQFIPATWLEQGVDGDGDGHRNPWSTADALSSTANYLRNSGWVRGLEPFYEVQLPSNFDYTLIGTKMPFSQWRNLGVIPLTSTYMDANTPLELWLPAGQDGPALLLSKNFDVIKVYNNSSNYALGVSLLAKAISGQGGLQKAWPRYEQPLSTYQVKTLQQRLTNAGYDTRGVDGIIGTNTRKAFARWQANNGQIPDGFISKRSAGSLIW
ncbi:lytic murein transglycosylase [Psychrobacter sp. I-STPA6b]|uniref:lytic murein transglycosylase n=1 Tax=Psychrobacter sp. I-STPA6b TaxID=2585718 RepID=UPI0022222186|nr:lytic murein transglycosylase [Psychrobacter sp. I-STPA6b]